MNCFRRHLNWTLVFGWVMTMWLFIMPAVFEFHFGGGDIAAIYMWLVVSMGVVITAWALKQKGRSLFNLFWLLLSWIGIVVILCMRKEAENKLGGK